MFIDKLASGHIIKNKSPRFIVEESVDELQSEVVSDTNLTARNGVSLETREVTAQTTVTKFLEKVSDG